MRWIIRVETMALLLTLICGCTKHRPEVEGYRVMSYDAATGQWIIICDGTFAGKYLRKRITAVCDFYRLGDHEIIRGPTACDLHVGEIITPNPFPKDRENFVDVWEMSADRLSITAGSGPSRTEQQFIIVKEETISN